MSVLHEGDRLTPELVDLVAHIAASLGPPGPSIVAQAESATVEVYSPTMLDLVVPPDATPVPLPDGPTPGRALIYVGDDLVGEVLLWIRTGRILGLEQAWYTDEPPTEWPDPGQVRVS